MFARSGISTAIWQDQRSEGRRASLGLQFAGATELDSRITFTRGSNATMVGSNGLIQYAPHNLLTYSQEFDNAAWTSSATVVANAAIAPDGTLTADSITPSANDQTSYQLASTGSVIGRTFSLSVWLKADISHTATIRMYDNFAAESFSSNVTVTQVWQRFSLTATWTTGTGNLVSMIYPKLMGSGAANLTVYAWGAQLNVGALQPYYPTTSAAYYGPRLVYDPVTLAAQGLLVEEQRTNLLLQSEDFSNAAWVKYNGATIAANSVVSPDGASSADTLTCTAAQEIYQGASKTASALPYSFTIYAKKGSTNNIQILFSDFVNGTAAYQYDINNGTASYLALSVWTGMTATIQATIDGWYKCTLTATSPATANVFVSVRTAASGTVYIWGAQLEAGAFATSYIPTTTAQATRAADVATMTGTNFSSWFNANEGSFFVDYAGNSANPASANQGIFSCGPGDYFSSVSVSALINANGIIMSYNLSGTQISAMATPRAVVGKLGSSYSSASITSVVNGGTVATATNTLTLAGINSISLGFTSLGALNGTIKSITYYPRRLANTELQALTS